MSIEDKKNIVFHIGLHKTGTTSLQSGFYQNQESLLAEGIYLPKSCMENSRSQIIHSNLPWQLLNHKGYMPSLGTLEDLVDEVSHVNCSNVIITSEGLSRLKRPEELLSRFVGFNLKVLFYIRRQDIIAPSRYTEDLKFGYSHDFEVWLATKAKNYFNFNSIYRLWYPLVDDVIVRVLDKDRFLGGNILNDFLISSGCLHSASYDYTTSTNQRIGALSVFSLLHYNKLTNNYTDSYKGIHGNVKIISQFRSIINDIVGDCDLPYNPFNYDQAKGFLTIFDKSIIIYLERLSRMALPILALKIILPLLLIV